MLFPILNRKTTLKKKCSLFIYKQLLRSLITYTLALSGQMRSYPLKKTPDISKQDLKNNN